MYIFWDMGGDRMRFISKYIDNSKQHWFWIAASKYIQYLSKESDILFCSITHANLGQFLKLGTDLESAGTKVFKTPPTCAIWPSFGWDIWG